jgi:hypothetical protein
MRNSNVGCDVDVKEKDRKGSEIIFNVDETPLAHDLQQANTGI